MHAFMRCVSSFKKSLTAFSHLHLNVMVNAVTVGFEPLLLLSGDTRHQRGSDSAASLHSIIKASATTTFSYGHKHDHIYQTYLKQHLQQHEGKLTSFQICSQTLRAISYTYVIAGFRLICYFHASCL